MASRRTILFVDDERLVLQDLELVLRVDKSRYTPAPRCCVSRGGRAISARRSTTGFIDSAAGLRGRIFGTHAALSGVNPWRLQTWTGHKRIDEAMLYVHVAEAHSRELPESVAGSGARVHRSRSAHSRDARRARGSHVAASTTSANERSAC
jgi:hypothetical protein